MALVRKDLTKKVTFRQSLEGDEGARPGHPGKNIPGRRVHKYKRPEMRVCLTCLRNHKKPSVSEKVYVRGKHWKIRLGVDL